MSVSLPNTYSAERPLRRRAGTVLLDIEGTISPVSFVRDTLFPYSKARLKGYVAANRNDPLVQDILADATALASGTDAVSALIDWHERDIKAPPLKKLQGLIWEDGYRSGVLRSALFPGVLPALEQWKASGLPLYVYSSGSVHAQHLFFEFNREGDLRPLLSGYFDTEIGPKTAALSYLRIAEEIRKAPRDILFLSDNAEELAAARSAGLEVIQIVKDSTPPSTDFIQVSDYGSLSIAPAEQSAARAAIPAT